jgi:hypothetical protein
MRKAELLRAIPEALSDIHQEGLNGQPGAFALELSQHILLNDSEYVRRRASRREALATFGIEMSALPNENNHLLASSSLFTALAELEAEGAIDSYSVNTADVSGVVSERLVYRLSRDVVTEHQLTSRRDEVVSSERLVPLG